MESDDTGEWARAVAGDGRAFGLLFDRHEPRVRRHLGRLLASPYEVEDAVAIVFLEAWRRRSDVRVVEASLLPWLLVTATHVANNVRRGRRRYRALLDRLPPIVPVDADIPVLDEGEAVAALRGLSLADRQVLTLCVLEGWSERDAAEALQVRPGTVKSRLHRAKRRLADQFAVVTSASVEGIRHGF